MPLLSLKFAFQPKNHFEIVQTLAICHFAQNLQNMLEITQTTIL